MMTIIERMTVLRTLAPFDLLAPAELLQVADACAEKNYSAGQIVFERGKPLLAVHVVCEGSIVMDGRECGRIFGVEGVLFHRVLSATALAGSTGARCLTLGCGKFFTLANECPAFTLGFAATARARAWQYAAPGDIQ